MKIDDFFLAARMRGFLRCSSALRGRLGDRALAVAWRRAERLETREWAKVARRETTAYWRLPESADVARRCGWKMRADRSRGCDARGSRFTFDELMNLVRDSEGSIVYGALGVHVYYVRFTGKLSARLGTAHLSDLQQVLEAGTAVSYFADSSELSSFDLLARSALVRLLLSYRKRFAKVVILNSATGAGAGAGASAPGQALAATVGDPVEILDDRNEFERRLTTAAPRALAIIRGAGAAHSGVMAVEGPSPALRATRRSARE